MLSSRRNLISMKKTNCFLTLLLTVVIGMQLIGCDDYETYAEMKEKEMKSIEQFIKDMDIKVIDFATFCAQDSTTDVSKNEYVFLEGDGVYMQIVRKGEGRHQNKDENRSYLVRYMEQSVADRDTVTGNLYTQSPDVFTCKRTGDTYSGTFTYGWMYSIYGPNVPMGWLSPMPYITPGRPNDKGAHVRLIVPHDVGSSTALKYITAYFYDINYMPEL